MSKQVIQTDQAPQAIGPYSQAISSGQLVFCSGQVPLDPATGKLVEGDAAAQAAQVMKNLGAVLAAAGLGFGDLVKTTIYLTDLQSFAAVNEVYGGFFTADPPARATVQVGALPLGAAVEIDGIAVKS